MAMLVHKGYLNGELVINVIKLEALDRDQRVIHHIVQRETITWLEGPQNTPHL